MRNFYEVQGNYFLNIQNYIEQWEKKLGISMSLDNAAKAKLQSLGSLSKNLWDIFNTDREENTIVKDKNYMDSPNGLHGYLASFLLPNIERVFALLVKDENSIVLKNYFRNEIEEFTILDFGAGPLSASVGFICALEYLCQQDLNLIPPKKIKILAIERSEKIFNAGKNLLLESIFNSETNLVDVERITSPQKIQNSIHIALCLNIFNEIPKKHRVTHLNACVDKLHPQGAVLIMEPAQNTHAKALGTLRDEIISKNENTIQVISPCAHTQACPLSESTSRTDWCWFRHGWNQPPLLKEIERYSGIDHHFLNFSYLFFVKSPVALIEPYYARVVSEKLNVYFEKKSAKDFFMHNIVRGEKKEVENYIQENQPLLKMLLCAQDGDLQSILLNTQQEIEFKKGMRISNVNKLEMIFKERN